MQNHDRTFCQPILTWVQDGELITEKQPILEIFYGLTDSRIMVCPQCGNPWAKCTMYVQSWDGPKRRDYVAKTMLCPTCADPTKLDDMDLPLLGNVIFYRPELSRQAFIHDATYMLTIMKPQLLGEPAQ